LSSISRSVILSMLGSEFDNNFICLPSVGASGGIMIAWRIRMGTVGATRVDAHSISVQFCPSSGSAWWLTCVYGPLGQDPISPGTEGHKSSVHWALAGGRGFQSDL
jgi:hypothetical protein